MCIKLISKNATHQAPVDECLRGFYSNSFFHIYIDGDFKPVISDITLQKDKGTAMHEYTHYIQNIGTLWGLYCSIQQYETIIEFKNNIIAATEIKRPFEFRLTESLERKRNNIRHGNGMIGYPKWNLNTNEPIVIDLNDVVVNGKNQKRVDVSFTLIDGSKQTIQLGAHIIKESMAAMYQSLLDPEAAHDDVPYNLVRLIAEKHFPNTAKDIKNLISCCYISLFNMSPGFGLIDILREAETNNLNGLELFDEYVHTKIVTTGTGEKKNMTEFFNDMLNGFKNMLTANLTAPLDYIATVLDRVRLDGNYYPFISVLYGNGGFSEKDFTAIIGYYGIPYIQTSKYGIYHPQGIDEHGEEGSLDVLELIVQEALYISFVDSKHLYCCPLYYMCQGSQYEKTECFGNPWEGGMCSYRIVSDSLGLDKKKIF